MATATATGKKGKKSKGKTLSLNNFLHDAAGGAAPSLPVRSSLNWADEVEDSYEAYDGRTSKATNIVLPTAPKAARGLDDFTDKIPQNPPYIAYLSNLPYDVDEDEIADFFRTLKISNMRIPKEERAGEGTRVRGFGYVEFEDQESLIEALAKPVCTLKGRRVRIEVATSSDAERRRGGNRMEMNRDRPDRPEVSTGDWRSGGRKELDVERRNERNREYNRDRGESGQVERAGAWRDGADRPSFRDTTDRPSFRDSADRSSFRDSDRFREPREDKPITRDAPPREAPARERFERDGDRSRGFGPRREREDRNGGFSRRDDRDLEKRDDARTRPKLNLIPRTKLAEDDVKETADVQPAPVPATSIFGNAKPVDTTARERQIEERLAKQNTEIEKRDDDKRRDETRGPMRRGSPDRQRRASPERARRTSPDRARRTSPDRARRTSSDRTRRLSPEKNRRGSPDRRRGSPDRRRGSPDRKRNSPDRKRNSPDRRGSLERRRSSPDRERGSPDGTRRYSPDRKRYSPDNKSESPENRRSSLDRNRASSRKDDKRAPTAKSDKPPPKEKNEKRPTREYTERDMPKLKQAEPIPIVATNQYSFLQEGVDDSD